MPGGRCRRRAREVRGNVTAGPERPFPARVCPSDPASGASSPASRGAFGVSAPDARPIGSPLPLAPIAPARLGRCRPQTTEGQPTPSPHPRPHLRLPLRPDLLSAPTSPPDPLSFQARRRRTRRTAAFRHSKHLSPERGDVTAVTERFGLPAFIVEAFRCTVLWALAPRTPSAHTPDCIKHTCQRLSGDGEYTPYPNSCLP